MPWIEQIPVDQATGLLKEQFDQALRRAGRVWHIVHVQSINPRVMRDGVNFYIAVMFAPSPLSRAQREMLATVVSAEHHCHY